MRRVFKPYALPLLGLFASTGTLICCALPALMVTIGAGAALAGLVSAAPWLVALTAHKEWLFAVAGFVLLLAGVLRYRARHAPCPVEPEAAQACMRLRQLGTWIYGLSLAIYVTGFFFAFIAVRVWY